MTRKGECSVVGSSGPPKPTDDVWTYVASALFMWWWVDYDDHQGGVRGKLAFIYPVLLPVTLKYKIKGLRFDTNSCPDISSKISRLWNVPFAKSLLDEHGTCDLWGTTTIFMFLYVIASCQRAQRNLDQEVILMCRRLNRPRSDRVHNNKSLA
jgi:hypothetical protein